MHILHEITAHKKIEVCRNRREKPDSELFAEIKAQNKTRPFFADLETMSSVAVISEIKKASPSAGVIREDFDPVKIAESYASSGASAISVLTDESFFQGSLEYLRHVHAIVDLPCLRKDFIINPYQVLEARAGGADIILLIMAILSDSQFDELSGAAREFNMECLVEVHDNSEVERAMRQEATNIGINNRDLTTFEVDMKTTDKLLAILPPDIKTVSESGLKRRKDIEHLGRQGVDAVLIGESLMREPDMPAALQNFVGVEKWSR